MPLEKQYDFEDFWLVKLKDRLQWTGWLQYLVPMVPALVCQVFSSAAKLVAGDSVAAPFLVQLPRAMSYFLLANVALDVITCKFDFRPPEPVPKRRDGASAFDVMQARRSCRSFQSRKLTAKDHAELMDCVRRHTDPSHVLGSKPIRLVYISAPMRVWPVVGASEFLVALAPKDYDATAVVDVGRSLQKVVLHATRMGLGTCWIGPGADQESIIQHLGSRFNRERDRVVVTCAIGYASMYMPLMLRFVSAAQGSSRLPLSSLFYEDGSFSKPLDVYRPPISRLRQCFEACRRAPSSYNAQPTRCAAVEGNGAADELPRFDFYSANEKSRFYAPLALGIWLCNWETGCEELGAQGRLCRLDEDTLVGKRAACPHKYYMSWVPIAQQIGKRRVD